jgi:DNA-directed RNA polymerase subunit RPC12/RpoP
MAVKAKIGAGVWDMLLCEHCTHSWTVNDLDYEWTDDPEEGAIACPRCGSEHTIREERG